MSFSVVYLHFCLFSPKTNKFSFDGSEATTKEAKKQGRILSKLSEKTTKI